MDPFLEQLRSALDATAQQLDAAEAVAQQVAELQGDLVAAEERVSQLTGENTVLVGSNRVLQETIAGQAVTLAARDAEIAIHLATIAAITAERDTALANYAQAAGMVDALNASIADYQSQMSLKDVELATLRAQLAALQAENLNHVSALSSLHAQVDHQNDTIASLNATIASLNATITTRDAEIDALRASAEVLQGLIAQATDGITARDAQIANLQSQIASLQAVVTERNASIASLQSSVSTLQAAVTAKDAEIASLSSALALCEAALEACQEGGGGGGGPTGPLSNLLVPTDPTKLLIGASTPRGYADYTTRVGKPLHIVHTYATSASDVSSDLSQLPAGTIPLINFKPLNEMGPGAYTDILNGFADSSIDAAANHIKTYGKPVFLAPLHEPENDDASGASDASYAAAFRRIVTRVRAITDKAIIVWNMMSFASHGPRYDTLYPGDAYVDWIGADPYCHNTAHNTFKKIFNKTSSTFPGFYTWAAPKGKPIMICEWGVDRQVAPTVAPVIFTQAEVSRMLTEMPLVRALVYWDQWLPPQTDPGVDYRIQNFATHYRNFANLPNFELDISSVAK